MIKKPSKYLLKTLHKVYRNYSIKTRPEQQYLRKYLIQNKKPQKISPMGYFIT